MTHTISPYTYAVTMARRRFTGPMHSIVGYRDGRSFNRVIPSGILFR